MYRYIALLLGAAALLGGIDASAQSYPSRPVKFVVPFPPGPADMFVRLYAQKLTEQLGQPFVIENRPGATGTIGAAVVAKAPADGYTLLGTVDLPVVKAPNLVKIPYDPVKDLVPIAMIGEDFNMLAVHPATGFRTPAALAPHIQAGKVTPLGITSLTPSPLIPGMTPLAGTWPGFELTNWYGFLAPAGTPEPVITVLRQALRKVFDDEDVKQRLTASNIQPKWTEGPAAATRVSGDLAKWGKVIRDANIKAD